MTAHGRALILILLLASSWVEHQALAVKAVRLPSAARFAGTDVLTHAFRDRQLTPGTRPPLAHSGTMAMRSTSGPELSEASRRTPIGAAQLYVLMSLQC
jgi:hypothetical protein